MTRPPRACDVAVIGAGFAGLTAALALAEGGVAVSLFEKAPAVGTGASGQGPGYAGIGVLEHPWRWRSSLGEAGARGLVEFNLVNLEVARRRGSFRGGGAAWAAVDPREVAEVRQSAQALRDLGLAVDLVSGADLEARLGVRGLQEGFVTAEGGTVDPERTLEGLALALLDRGGQLHCGVSVSQTVDSADAIELIWEGPEGPGRTRCEALVFAAGADLETIDRRFEKIITSTREQFVEVEVSDEGALKIPLRTGFGWTRAARIGGRLRWSGCAWASPHFEIGETEPGLVPKIQDKLDQFGDHHLPIAGLARHRGSYRWGRPCDLLPIIGPWPGDPRRVACGGFVDHDAGFAFAAGEAVARGLLTGGDGSVPKILSPARFL